MALVKCPECNREISDSAKVCPSCGYKTKRMLYKKRNKIILGIILFITIACIGLGIINYVNKRNKALEALDKEFIELMEYPQRPYSYGGLSFLMLHDDLWSISQNDFIEIRTACTKAHINNIPFEQSEIYLKWDSYYKYKFTRKK